MLVFTSFSATVNNKQTNIEKFNFLPFTRKTRSNDTRTFYALNFHTCNFRSTTNDLLQQKTVFRVHDLSDM